MNYYEHHLGDYDGATAHLSWLEDCAYRRLICLYYRTEAPLPADIKQVCRLVRASSKQERDAVEQVLGEFFSKEQDGWHHDRCDLELAEFQEKAPEREAKRENAKERQRRARERRAKLFTDLRSHGIVPPFDAKTSELEDMLSRATSQPPSRNVTPPVTRDNTATQTPDPRPQKNTSAAAPPPDGVSPSTWADFLKLRKAKKAPMTDTALQGIRLEAGKAGITLEEALKTCCKRGWQGFEAGWINGNHKPGAPSADDWTRGAQ